MVPCSRQHVRLGAPPRACIAAAGCPGGKARLVVSTAARKEYKAATRRACRAHERAVELKRREAMQTDPRAFWGSYKEKGSPVGAIGLEEWTAYFRELLDAQPGDAESGAGDGALFDKIFRTVEGGSDAAAGLNGTITQEEVLRALNSLGKGKASGMDGMPAEFLQEADGPRVRGGGRGGAGCTLWCGLRCPCSTGCFRRGTLGCGAQGSWHRCRRSGGHR